METPEDDRFPADRGQAGGRPGAGRAGRGMKMNNAKTIPDEFLASMAEVVKLLGNVQRLRILEYLDLNGESTVTEIVGGIRAAQGAVSQQLNKLRAAGVVACRREGRRVIYSLASTNAVTILNCMRRKCGMETSFGNTEEY